MNTRKIIITSGILMTFCSFLISCGSNSSNENPSSYNSKEQSKTKEETTINGVYTYKDNSAILKITVSGNSWSGKTIMISGAGEEYDNQNAKYDNGIVKGSDLYESSGNVKIGYINGNSLTTSIANSQVTLSK